MANDLRLVELQERKPQAFGIREIVGTLVAGGILMMVGIFAYSKVRGSISQAQFTAEENTAFANVRTNVTSGFDIGSIVFIMVAVAGIIGVIFLAFR